MVFEVIVIFCLYFLPALIGNARRHRNGNAITVLNIFLGWTLLGWVGALVWACTDNCKPREGIRMLLPAERVEKPFTRWS